MQEGSYYQNFKNQLDLIAKWPTISVNPRPEMIDKAVKFIAEIGYYQDSQTYYHLFVFPTDYSALQEKKMALPQLSDFLVL